MLKRVRKNIYGFHELVSKPNLKTLQDYYSKKYYQELKGNYNSNYTPEELKYIENQLKRNYFLINKMLGCRRYKKSFLDVGSGEGWALNFFYKLKWNVTGLDFSEFSCKKFNPTCSSHVLVGDINDNLLDLLKKGEKYDVILLDNVLEHVLYPLSILKYCNKLIKKTGVLVVEVPNDFSILQNYLLKKNYINNKFWIAYPDHISYFNKDGLENLARRAGWKCYFTLTGYPIDFNLVNQNTNYIRDKTLGKSCHVARIELENLIYSISFEKAINYGRSLAELGLGRDIVSFFKPKL